ncbi:MAG TPA: LLM class flavin-dependent oxidoreductase [Candidatus Xenobia bacterium]|jgi:alkanesulfonate monooxygenase SsuD/methylene tetrahydromethanopterin reductase-like flavin-dependent oxidoreductase (luciferase family)
MDVAIGLPNTIEGVTPQLLLDWARRADAGPFSSLGAIDRLAYPNYDPFTSLAVAAGATRRIRLMTTVLLAPLHRPGMLAKQLLTLHTLSGGRLTVGLGLGARREDYEAAPASFEERGQQLERTLDLLQDAFRQGPAVLLGGHSPKSIQRVGRWGDGYIDSSGTAAGARHTYGLADQAWAHGGRPGRPRKVAGFYWCLGRQSDAIEHLRTYYGFAPPQAEKLVGALVSTEDDIRSLLHALAEAGTDEAVAWPCVASLDQVDRLATLL